VKKSIIALLISITLSFVFIFSTPKIAKAQDCTSELGGQCRTSCQSDEQWVTATGCSPGPRGGERCCLPRALVSPVPCPGVCRPFCVSGESRFLNVNSCDASGQDCCQINPLVEQDNPTAGCAGGESINTAIGCIPVASNEDFIGFILRWAIGIGGGIAFLLILVAGFQIMTSQGNPDKLQAGKELITSAIVGLILIIFSIFILELIGVEILGIPGFGD